MILTSFLNQLYLFQPRIKYFYNFFVQNKKKSLDTDEWNNIKNLSRIFSKQMRLAVVADGGMGDCLVHLNYIYHLNIFLDKKFPIDFYFKNKKTALNLYEKKDNYIDIFFNKKSIKYTKKFYAAVIVMNERFPRIYFLNKYSNILSNLKFKSLNDSYHTFYKNNYFYYKNSPRIDGLSALFSICQGYNRINQPDIEHILKIKDIHINTCIDNEDAVLKKYSLTKYHFITLNRSVDSTRNSPNSTKLWPKQYYSELIDLLRHEFKDYPIVYLSPYPEKCLNGSIMNLSGKTTINELKVLLKYSYLHVGPEGGMIHLRHVLARRPSCVLFGPTNIEFYGYPENINLTSNQCFVECEWFTESWQEFCLNNKSGTCEKLKKLTPNHVIKAIKFYYKR